MLCACVSVEGGDGEGVGSETPSLKSYTLRYVSLAELGTVFKEFPPAPNKSPLALERNSEKKYAKVSSGNPGRVRTCNPCREVVKCVVVKMASFHFLEDLLSKF